MKNRLLLAATCGLLLHWGLLLPGGQAAKAQALGQFKLFAGDKALAAQGLGNELSGVWRQAGDIANGAGAWTFRGTEGLPDQVGVAGGRALGGLDEHSRYRIMI